MGNKHNSFLVSYWYSQQGKKKKFWNTDWKKNIRLILCLLCNCLCTIYQRILLVDAVLYFCVALHWENLFFDWVSLCSSGWPWTCDLPASASRLLGLQACTTTTGLIINFQMLNQSHVLRINSILSSYIIPFVYCWIKFDISVGIFVSVWSKICPGLNFTSVLYVPAVALGQERVTGYKRINFCSALYTLSCCLWFYAKHISLL
jgi:hypothetical protein